MALAACRECGKQVSTAAKSCPSCGVAQPVRPKIGGGTILLGFIAFAAIIAGFRGTSSDSSAPTPAAAVPPDPAIAAAKEKKEAAFRTVVGALVFIKKNARDPESVKFESITAADDASLICIVYRARNGFGGMNIEHASIDKTGFGQDAASWNRKCAGKRLTDFSHATYAL